MKKTIALLCAGIIACTVASCGNDNSREDVQQNIPSQTEGVQGENNEQTDEINTSVKKDETETEADTDTKSERSADENNTETEADAGMENGN